MKKIIFLGIATLMATLTWTPGNAQTYCTPSYSTGCSSDKITNVSLDGETISLDNTTQCSSNAYGDFTGMDQPDLDLGATYTISISTDYSVPSSEDVRAWIDYDDDGTFDDSDEIVPSSEFDSSGTSSFDFTVGVARPLGSHRMRVRLVYGGTPIDPCADETWGETEDYMVNITGTPPTCYPPTGLTVDAAGATTADISWTTGDNNETDWVVQYGEVGFDPESEGDSQAVSGSPETTLTGLTSSTSYEVYVKAQCGGTDGSDDSIFAGPESFATACVTIPAPWNEDFENGGDIPLCWNQGDNNNEDWLFSDDPSGEHVGNNGTVTGSTPSGGYFAWVDDSTPDNQGTTLLSPLIDVSALTIPELSFYLISDNEGDSNVDFSVDVYDGAAWNDDVFTSNSNTANGGWEEIIVDLSTLTITGDIQIRFVVDEPDNGDFDDDLAIDDVSVHEQPTCQKPTDLLVDFADATTADLSWTASDSETDWVVYYGEAGFDPDNSEGDTESVSGSPNTTLTGLNSSTTYEFYVQAQCAGPGGGDDSMLAGPVSFATSCVAVTAPWNEDFENGGDIPLCWNQGDNNGKDWEFSDDTGSDHIGDNGTIIGSTPSGGYFAWVDDSTPDYDNTTLLSPLIDVSALTIPELTFYLLSNNEGNADATISVDVFDGDAWNNDLFTSSSNTANGGWEEITVDLSNLTITGNIQIRFIVDDVNSDFYDDIAIDDVDVHEQPTCQKPTDLTVDGGTETSADVSWTAAGSESSWNISWGPSGYSPGDTDEIDTGTASTTSFGITGLTADTEYEVYVQADCGSEQSFWAGPLPVFTGYCIPTGSSNNSDEILNFTLSDLDNDSASSEGTDGYSDYSSSVSPATIQAGVPYEASLTSGSGSGDHGAAIWIDYNQNLIFEESEMVASIPETIGSNSTVDFPAFIVPASTPQTTYRLRVQYHYNAVGGTLDPCTTSSSFSETEDYSIDVQAPPACPQPTVLTVDTAGAETVDISWTAGDAESSWNISWGTPGYTPGDTDEIGTATSSDNSYQITGLTPTTDYEFYVQADCGSGEESSFTGPESFTTECVAEVAPWSEDFENGGAIPDCWTQGAANGKDWEFSDGPGSNHIGDNGTIIGSTPSGGYFAWVDDSTPDYDNTTLLSPLIDVSALTTPELTFYLLSNNEGNADATISVDVFDGDAWNNDLFSSSSNTADGGWEEITVNLSNLTITGNIQIRFIVDDVNSDFYDDIAIDDVDVHEQPSCPKPFDLIVDATDATTADLSWTAGDSETDWVVYYGEAGFDPDNNEGNTESVSGSPNISLTGLNSSSVYEFYVQAQCAGPGGGDDSMLGGPVSFATSCVAVTAPWNEDFENNGDIPHCWNQGSNNSKDWEFTDDPSGEHIGDDGTIIGSTPSGGYFAWVDDSSSEYDNTTLISPLIDVSGLTIPELTFFLLSNNEGNSNATLSVDVYDGAAWNEDVFTNNANTANGGWEEIIVDLSTLTITGDIQIRFIVDDVNSDFYDDIAIDDVNVHEQPTCQKPTDLMVELTSMSTADISWVEADSSTEWVVVYGLAGFDPDDPGAGTSETVNNDPNLTITGLTLNEDYDFYVKSICSTTDESFWTGPASLHTGYCVPENNSSTSNYISNFNTAEALQNIDNASNFSDNGYGDYTDDQNLIVYPGQETTITVDFQGGTSHVEVWIDYNHNGDFDDAGEHVLSSGSYVSSPYSETITIPTDFNGDVTTRMRVRAQYLGGEPGPCEESGYGETEDYTIQITEPSCFPPTNVLIDPIGDVTAFVSWDAPDSQNEWEVVYGEAGFDPDNGTIISVTGSPETSIDGLTSETAYDVYVRAICGSDESILVGPVNFTTGITPPVNNFACDAIALTANSGCGDGPYTTVGAFEEQNEPNGSCLTDDFHGTNSVWFTFVGPSNGEATITTDFPQTEHNMEIVVFEAPTDCEDMSTLGDEVGCASSGSDAVLTDLTPGDTYYVKAAGFNNLAGEFCIEVQTEGDVPDPCLSPSDITVEVQETSVDVSWTPGGNETQWEVIYGEPGFSPQGGGQTETVNGTPEITLTDLEPETDYDVYVRALCDDDNTSDWTGPESFNSGDLSVKDQVFENFTFYPNPVDSQLTLKAGTPIESVSVYNLLGQTVMTETPNQLQTQLNTEGLQSGVYLMKVNLNGSTKTFRVVKN